MGVYELINGQSPQNLKVGDSVNTGGGLFQIVHPGTPGSQYNSKSGYTSIKVNGNLQDSLTAYAQAQSERNTAKSEQMANKQMSFQNESNAKAMQFSAQQAQLNRDFQEKLSSNAHQREVADLVAAGLNPVLSTRYGGSSTPSGSAASGVSSSGSQGQVDNSSQQMLGALLSAVISQATALQTTSMNNMTALESSKISAGAVLGSSNINAKSQQYMQSIDNSFKDYMSKTYPATEVQAVSSIIHQLRDLYNKNKGAASSYKPSKNITFK